MNGRERARGRYSVRATTNTHETAMLTISAAQAALLCATTMLQPTQPLSGSNQASTDPGQQAGRVELELPFERHELPNGLTVIIHEDHSAPVVAVNVHYHVGSAQEERGRSGFAHLFEHMMFQGSMNVGNDEHFRLIQEAGGTLNGTTNSDRTNYYETLPSNQLELALWLEADRMGFLLPAMDQEKLDNQREVVRNERRQNYTNRPYGRVRESWSRALYPLGHPYNHITIGSEADLDAASLEDVRSFFLRWYGPNNATLAIAGDVDPNQALELVRKYFLSIPRGPQVQAPEAAPVQLTQTKRVLLEDNVQDPQLDIIWPTVPMGHEDAASLDMLAQVLSANKAAVLDRLLFIEEQLVSQVSAGQQSAQLAGTFQISLRAKPGVDLSQLETRLRDILTKLTRSGIDEAELQRHKNRYQARSLSRLETLSARANLLAHEQTFRGDPGAWRTEFEKRLAVSSGDIKRVLKQYISTQPAVIVSTVPSGKAFLAANGISSAQRLVEEQLDRGKRPQPGPEPIFRAPTIVRSKLKNGLELVATSAGTVPMTRVQLCVPAGQNTLELEQAGLASLTAAMLSEGTRELSTTEFAAALDGIGASMSINADRDEIVFTMHALDSQLPAAIELLAETLLQPRFAQEDFDRVVSQRLTWIDARGDNASGTANRAYMRLLHGDAARGLPLLGTRASLESLTLDSVRNHWQQHGLPGGARLNIASNLELEELRTVLTPLLTRWNGGKARPREASFGRPGGNRSAAGPGLYLVDRPGATQSQLRIGHMSIATTDPDYDALIVLNTILGGSFSSRLNLNLREDKSYTYGARSSFAGGLEHGPFTASAGVHTNVTKESISEFLYELNNLVEAGISEEELEFAKATRIQAMHRQFESSQARLSLVNQISKYGFPDDILEQRLSRIEKLTRAELLSLARKHLDVERMIILVVGDAQTITPGLHELGFGAPVMLDIDGVPIN